MIRVNDRTLSEKEIIAEMQYHPAENHDEAYKKASEALVISTLLTQRAASLGFEVENETLEESDLDQLLEKEIDIPSADETVCRQYFEQNAEKFMSSPLVEARHILLAAGPDEADLRSRAMEQGAQLITVLEAEPEQFAELAMQYSACPSKETGGSLGQLSKGQTVPEFERQLFRCEPGLVKKPLESRFGVHVVDIAHMEPGQYLPYEAVAEKIRDYLDEKVRRKSIAQYIESLIQEADIDGFDFSVSDSPLMQ